jgi:hypothetical protein
MIPTRGRTSERCKSKSVILIHGPYSNLKSNIGLGIEVESRFLVSDIYNYCDSLTPADEVVPSLAQSSEFVEIFRT